MTADLNLNADFLKRFRALEALDRLADSDVEETCRAIAAMREPSREAIRALCDIATMPAESRQTMGQRAIFSWIVERLGDSFEPADVAIYDRVFAQIIEYCRRLPEGTDIDHTLNRFGIRNETDVLDRKARLSQPRNFAAKPGHYNAVRRIFVLSRVTLGADVAVTSVIMNGLAMIFPNATITLMGPPPVSELYDTAGPFHTLGAPYARRGALLDRLNCWVELVRILDRERSGLSSAEYLIVDPDSRLTQLGLLPVTEDERRYFHFESRSFQRPRKERLSELAAVWMRETFGGSIDPEPFVRLSPRNTAFGAQSSQRLRHHGCAGIVAFNFGVGGNVRKQLALDFETQLVEILLGRGYSVVLDTGVGGERERVQHIVEKCRNDGRRVVQLDASNASAETTGTSDADLITWAGGPGPFAGLIACADLYIGYDSGFQHIAAALGRPVIDIFVDQSNERFIARWTPYSKAVQVARMNPEHSPRNAAQKILALIPGSP